MKFVLTGSTGFIGSHLQKYLQAQGHLVSAIRRGDTLDQMINILNETKPDVVIHLASCFIAEHKPTDIENLIQSNLLFGTQLLEAMTISGCRNLINTGTTWQQYKGDRNNPVCLYSATKNAFEEILKYYHQAENFNIVILKLSDSYGPNDKRGKLISKLIESLKTGQEFNLSPGEQKINLVHVNDIIGAFEIATKLDFKNLPKKLSDCTYTIADQSNSVVCSYSIQEIVALIESTAGKKLNVNFGARPYRKREIMTPDILDPILPRWNSIISLKQGLKELIHEY